MARQSGIFQTKMTLIIMLTIIVLSSVLAVPCYCMDKNPIAPWDYKDSVPDKKETPAQETDASVCGRLLIEAIRFYQDYISPVIGDRCEMQPSCSHYAVDAIKKHGCLIGSVMTSDRLIHEANEMDVAPVIETKEEPRYYDPVGSNDFWWQKTPGGNASQPDK